MVELKVPEEELVEELEEKEVGQGMTMQSKASVIEIFFNDPINSTFVFSPVLSVKLGSLLVGRRLQVRLREERLDVSQYVGHILGRAPVGERNSAVRRNVGVKHLTEELHSGRLEWIVWWKCESELKNSKFHDGIRQTTDNAVPGQDVASYRCCRNSGCWIFCQSREFSQ